MQGIRHGGAAATEVELRCSELGCDLWALILSAKDGEVQGGAHLALNRAVVPCRGSTAASRRFQAWQVGGARGGAAWTAP